PSEILTERCHDESRVPRRDEPRKLFAGGVQPPSRGFVHRKVDWKDRHRLAPAILTLCCRRVVRNDDRAETTQSDPAAFVFLGSVSAKRKRDCVGTPGPPTTKFVEGLPLKKTVGTSKCPTC